MKSFHIPTPNSKRNFSYHRQHNVSSTKGGDKKDDKKGWQKDDNPKKGDKKWQQHKIDP